MAHHSKFEIIRTDEEFDEDMSKVLKKVRVLKLSDFLREFKSNPHDDCFTHLSDVPISDKTLDEFDVFFFRQRFIQSNSSYIPELK